LGGSTVLVKDKTVRQKGLDASIFEDVTMQVKSERSQVVCGRNSESPVASNENAEIRRPRTSVLVFACLAIVIYGVSIASAYGHPLKMRVGVVSGLTGAAAKWCNFQNMGMRLAQEELESQGNEIELLFEGLRRI
jgi:hypothetical protein